MTRLTLACTMVDMENTIAHEERPESTLIATRDELRMLVSAIRSADADRAPGLREVDAMRSLLSKLDAQLTAFEKSRW